jgi:transketolase
MGIEDLALVGGFPTMVILVPSDPTTMKAAVKAATDYVGPVWLRSSRISMPKIYPDDLTFTIGEAITAREGTDLTIIANGMMVAASLDAAQTLSEEGIDARVIDLHTLRPIDKATIIKAARETGALVTAEEHLLHGGMGANVARIVAESTPVPMRFVGLADTYVESGDPDDLLVKYHLTARDIEEKAREVLAAKRQAI